MRNLALDVAVVIVPNGHPSLTTMQWLVALCKRLLLLDLPDLRCCRWCRFFGTIGPLLPGLVSFCLSRFLSLDLGLVLKAFQIIFTMLCTLRLLAGLPLGCCLALRLRFCLRLCLRLR